MSASQPTPPEDRSTSRLAGRSVVVVCQGVPHPSHGASRVLYYWYLKGLLDAGCSVSTLVLEQTGGQAEREDLDPLAEQLGSTDTFTVNGVPGYPPVRHSLTGVQVNADLAKRVANAVQGAGADLVLCLDWVAAAVTQTIPTPRVVWLGDLQFDTLRYHTTYAVREGSRRFDRLLLLPWRIHQLRGFYRRILSEAEAVIVSSKSSEARLAALGLPSTYLPYPWPALPRHKPAEPKAACPSFLFGGTLQALGSRSAFHALFADLYPRIRAAFGEGGFSILVTGHGKTPDWVRKHLETKPEVEFLGFVDDLAAVMATCTAFIAPIDVPVGNRSRILTAMSAGLAVIAHPSTALGNPILRDGDTCLLASDPDEFVARMTALSQDSAAAIALADRAEAAYRAHHAVDAANAMLIAHLARVAPNG